MKKLLTGIFGFVLVCFSANADKKIGFTAAISAFDTSGTETLKSSSNKTSTDVSETVIVPSIFFELSNDNGVGIGIDYVPVDAEIGNKSKAKVDTDTDDASDTSGTNKASADVTGHTTVYLIVPVRAAFLKLGYVSADVDTTETLATGTTYGNASVDGKMISVGVDRDMPNGSFMRLEASYTDYDDISLTGSADTDGVSNKVTADVDSMAFRISVGRAF